MNLILNWSENNMKLIFNAVNGPNSRQEKLRHKSYCKTENLKLMNINKGLKIKIIQMKNKDESLKAKSFKNIKLMIKK